LTICEDFLTFLKNPYPKIFAFAIIHCDMPLIMQGTENINNSIKAKTEIAVGLS